MFKFDELAGMDNFPHNKVEYRRLRRMALFNWELAENAAQIGDAIEEYDRVDIAEDYEYKAIAIADKMTTKQEYHVVIHLLNL